jgi:amidase
MQEESILELQNKMQSGELTSVQITERYLERIRQIDHSGPTINSVIELNPDALDLAAACDSERKSGYKRGPLHGIPVLIKDNIATGDRMSTTAGSLALEGSIAPRDAFIVERLRAAGAVLLGKTNLSEWANFRSPHSSSGWSSRGGQTLNPHALDRSPCGSSSGSGAAVAANLCAAAIGTETDGSIISPSRSNGIIGIKPTVGLIGRSGIIPISHTQDTAGPMARTVSDAAILLGAITGIDPRDPATNAAQGHALADYTPFLDAAGLKGARIGVARNCFGEDVRVNQVIEKCLLILKDQGAELVDPANLETEDKFGKHEIEVLLYEFKAGVNAYLTSLGPDAAQKSMAEIIDFNEKNRERVMPIFGQERMLQAQAKGSLNSKKYLKALQVCRELAREQGIDATLQKYKLDAIVYNAGPLAWLIDWVNGDSNISGGSSTAAVAGYPCITVPAGSVCGLPVGLCFTATAWQEPLLIRLAYAFEQASHARITPKFIPSTARIPMG